MASEIILKMMTSSGRLKYNEIQELAFKMPMAQFSELFLLPILVGQDLYKGTIEPVSYTHLTLPTIYSV